MHKVSISQSIVDRVVARRGREHIFEDLVPAKTALVVVDMQNGFMLPEVGHAPCQMAHEIVPNINRLAQAVRLTGGTVIWIQTAYTDETLTSWSTLYGMVGPKGEEKRRRSLWLALLTQTTSPLCRRMVSGSSTLPLVESRLL